MGFFKKIFRGIKKVVKKIGRGIKKAFMKVGKFMNKIGIVGQIALAFILPGIGTMLGQALGGLGSFGTALAGSTNFLAKAAGTIIKGAAHVASKVGLAFRTVSNAVGNYVGQFAQTAASKLGFNIQGAATNFFGADGAFAKAAQATGETWRAGFGSIEAVAKVSTEVVSSIVSETGAKVLKAEDLFGKDMVKKAGAKVLKAEDLFGTDMVKKAGTKLLKAEDIFGTDMVKEAGKKVWKAEDIFGKDMVETLSYRGVSPTSSNIAAGAIEEQGTSLLGRIGENITEGWANAKERVAVNIQTSIDDMIADPLGTAWKGAKAIYGGDSEAASGAYYPQDMTGLLTETNIRDFQATAMQMPYYGYTATLYDRFGYVPKSTWAKTMQGLV